MTNKTEIMAFLDRIEADVKRVRGYRRSDQSFGSAIDLIEQAFPALIELARKTSATDEEYFAAEKRGYGPWIDEILGRMRGKLYGTCVHCGRKSGTHRATIYHTESCETRGKDYSGPMS